MFEISPKYEFEAIGDERPNVVIPDPAPRCKLAVRNDTGDWYVATGAFFKRVYTEDGTTFRDVDGGIWRHLSTKTPFQPPQSKLRGIQDADD